MVDLNSDLGWVGVTRVETTDVALGGNEINQPNLANKQLASRDKWIRDQLEALVGLGDTTAQDSFDSFKTAGLASIAQGRLTLASGDPEAISDQLAATTLYYSPYVGDEISLWNATDSRWDVYQFTETYLSLSGLAQATNHDLFRYDSGGSITLQAVPWTSSAAGSSSRSQAISRRNGVYVKTSDNRRYLGTLRTRVTGQTEDSRQNRFLWNAANRIRKTLLKQMLGVGQYFYSGSAWRAANNDVDHQIRLISGLQGALRVDSGMNSNPAGVVAASAQAGIGFNSTTVNSGQISASRPNTVDQVLVTAFSNFQVESGYHYFQLLERGGTNEGFFGEAPDERGTSGILALWEC